MIRFATIGTGWIASSFVSATRIISDRMTLSAVYSRSYDTGRKFADQFDCKKIYTDLDELAADPEIDAVYIASPNVFHTAQSRIMLSAGKHVICEKPIAVHSEELIELQALAKDKGLIFMEALMAMHLPARTVIRNNLERIGTMSHVRFDFSQRSSKYDGLKKGEHQNIFDPKMETGAMMDLGIYCVYPCVDLFGLPDDISAFSVKLSTGADCEGAAVLKYQSITASITYSKTGPGCIGSEIIGDNGTIVIPSISRLNDVKLVSMDGKTEKLTGQLSKPEMMSFEAADFFRYITETADSAEEYRYMSRMSLEVCRLLEIMRKAADIGF